MIKDSTGQQALWLSKKAIVTVVTVATIIVAAILLLSGRGQPKNPSAPQQDTVTASSAQSEPVVELSPSQLESIKIEPVGTYLFPIEKEAVGSIDFDENFSVQVFPPYPGKILHTFVELGDEVHRGQPLYSIDSPDLIQAESALIGAAATYELTTKALARARELYTTSVGVPQKELEQAISDQQTAEGALKAARDAVRVFGKSEAEIDRIVATRKIDPALVVPSPIAGQITSRNAQLGLLVEPGNAPAPYTVADLSTKWMLANVPESETPNFHVGQPVEVKVMAYPGRVFRGRISKIYAAIDPNTHRITIRSEIADPKNELRPAMLANFAIRVRNPVQAAAIPANGVVREPDGSMTVWVATDRLRFVQKVVKTGLRRDGWVQILEGLRPGDRVVTDGAVFLSNMLEVPPSD
jgi:cobalt-zinc-cadmium efflux system membrane fusion protein